MSDGTGQPINENTPAPPPITQVQLGEALINPVWRGHLIVMQDNGGDAVLFALDHPRLGTINCIWARSQAAAIRDWLNMALVAPIMPAPQQQRQQSPIELPPAGSAD